MVVYLKQHQREKIGVDDNQAKQKQSSLEHQKQKQSDQYQKQLSPVTTREDRSDSIITTDNTKETSNNTEVESGDKKLNTIKMVAALETGSVIAEIPASALAGATPSTSVAAAHAVPALGLAAPLFGFF